MTRRYRTYRLDRRAREDKIIGASLIAFSLALYAATFALAYLGVL